MKKSRLTILIVLNSLFLLVVCGSTYAQENHLQFSVVNDTAHIDSAIPEDTLGDKLNFDGKTVLKVDISGGAAPGDFYMRGVAARRGGGH